LLVEMQPRFLAICELYGRAFGGQPLQIPKDLEPHFIRWRQVTVRHRGGDIRNTESEWKSMKLIAQWIIDVNCKLRGQRPKKLIWTE